MGMIDKMLGKAGGGAGAAPAVDLPGAGGPAEMEGPEAGEDTAMGLLDDSINDLTKLSAMLPEADMLVRRLESLRAKAEDFDKAGGAVGVGGEGVGPDMGGMMGAGAGAGSKLGY